jgi:hypothetical protein
VIADERITFARHGSWRGDFTNRLTRAVVRVGVGHASFRRSRRVQC